MKNERRAASIACVALTLASLPALLSGCRRVETDPQRTVGTLALIYSANVMGEIEPCG